MSEQALIPLEQRMVLFYDDEIVAIRAADGTIYVPLRPICDLLGVRWSGQYERLQRDPILTDVSRTVRVTRTEIDPSSRRPHTSDMVALPLDYLNGWLFGINASRVKEAVRPKVLQYQRDCYRVLAEAFREGRLSADSTWTDALQSDSPAAQAYRMAQAILQMARQQLLLESRVESAETRLTHHDERLESLEAALGDPARHISAAQASRISQAVKAIALALGRRSGRNEFGGVYGELYRRFDIAGYRELPAARFDEAMNFLRQWMQTLLDEGESVPF